MDRDHSEVLLGGGGGGVGGIEMKKQAVGGAAGGSQNPMSFGEELQYWTDRVSEGGLFI